jgi:hypothetical protein
MRVLPLDWHDGGEKLSGLVCPDCSGSVSVRADGPRRSLVFECRVGHAYALVDFLVSKEEAVETSLWRALYALQELADLLDELEAMAPDQPSPQARRRRGALARQHAAALRSIIEAEEPLSFDRPEEDPDLVDE